MKASRFSGYWILVCSATLGLAVLAYFKGVGFSASPYSRVISVLLIGALLLLLRAPLVGVWRWVAQHASNRKADGYQREPAARSGALASDVVLASQRAVQLKTALRQVHGWRWRYRRPWLLVSGDQSAVSHLSAGLSETGWAVTPDAVLLYAGGVENPNAAWLQKIRRMRLRRPVDAQVQLVSTANLNRRSGYASALSNQFSTLSRQLGWAAPAYVLNVVNVDGVAPASCRPVACTWSSLEAGSDAARNSLRSLSQQLADAGVEHLSKKRGDRYLARLSAHIAQNAAALSSLVLPTQQSHAMSSLVSGIFFAPVFPLDHSSGVSSGVDEVDLYDEPTQSTWQAIAAHSQKAYGRRAGFSWFYAIAWFAAFLAALWIAGTVTSGISNGRLIDHAAKVMVQHSPATNPTKALLDLDALQSHIDTLETRQREGAPWYCRFGLNRDAEVLAALWPTYASASHRALIEPIRSRLVESLQQLGMLTDQEIADDGAGHIKNSYGTLKAYLMLSEPKNADAKFLVPRLLATGAPEHPERSEYSAGAWADMTQRLVTFYANHLGNVNLPGNTSLALSGDGILINSARQTLIGAVGLQNSTDAIYRAIIEENRSKYPPVSLQSLLGDSSSRGLFVAQEMLDGLYTRAAWDERISKAIEEANEEHAVLGDWVLSDAPKSKVNDAKEVASDELAELSLKEELRQRYFADYARAWQKFLNSVYWQPDRTLSGTVDQLNLYVDPQRSPLSALFKVIVYQAGTGAVGQSLSDNLMNKMQKIAGGAVDPSKVSLGTEAPLASSFGPLLRLAGSDLSGNKSGQQASSTASSDISLLRYLERVSAVRLKLQQIMMSADPDAMSRTTAQAILQGKTSDLGDSRDYASRVAASLGQQWSGFADALFQRPMDQTWDVVLQPAASSLNGAWLSAIVSAWDQSFGGRYPFVDSDNDASLSEMARFLRTNNGLITQFVTSQLGGILNKQGDQWVVEQGAGRNALAVDPDFVRALNQLNHVANVMFPTGDASVRYELRAIPTPEITGLRFKLSGRELHYFNQKEEWTPFIWPGDALENNTHVEWQTESTGPRVAFDYSGRFGLIRLLERAAVTQQDDARYQLQWKADDVSQTPPLQVQMRSETGAGPLDVLRLRHFVLPKRIFLSAGSSRVEPVSRASEFERRATLAPVVSAPALPAPVSVSALINKPVVAPVVPKKSVLATLMETTPATTPAKPQTPVTVPVVVEAPAPKSESAPVTTAPAPAHSTPASENARRWFVHVGSYNYKAYAQNAIDSLSGFGSPVEAVPVAVKNGTQHRVRIGPFSTRADALKAQAKAVKKGYTHAWSSAESVSLPQSNAAAPVSE